MRNNIFQNMERALSWVSYWLAYTGGWIIRHPNRIFYAIILVLCLVFPFTGFFILLCLLCWSYWSQMGAYYG